MTSRKNSQQAAKNNQAGLDFYETWELQQAVAAFLSAVEAEPDNPEYHLNLARTYARQGDFGQAMQALGNYLHNETQDEVASRYEQMFSSALDEVEQAVTEVMPKLDMTLPQVGKALQMWLEYRIVAGRKPLRIPKPKTWAAALTFGIIKVNFLDTSRADVAAAYEVTEAALNKKYKELVEVLDLMPGDFRYYLGEENPLDRVLAAGESPEAAAILAELERRFTNGNGQ
ncbi:MAG: tetratricopeptide repeat protein [Ardenticatenaceae bacterium]|nr:tetratricopeptide repeat protein [Ardenticatenaceae bacterium]MCB9444587.1 tetratricopeptide repeat protein [Ardenticatenaceae bacterium]